MHAVPLRRVAIVVALAATAAAQDPELRREMSELRRRLDELEEQQAKTAERLGSRALVQSYTATSLDFGGHVSSLFTWMHGESDTEAGHMVSIVELYLRAQLGESWSLFATPGFYTFNGAMFDDPATPTAPVDPTFTADEIAESRVWLSRAYAEWRQGDLLAVQGGVVGSPHGTTNREYFIPARTIAQANLHTRYFTANQLYPQVIEGLRASGKYSLDVDWIDYDAYVGVQYDAPSDWVGGARLGYRFASLGLGIAANFGQGSRAGLSPTEQLTNFPYLQAPFAPQFNAGRDYRFGGLDVDWRLGEFVAKLEAYYSAEDGFEDQRALSAELTWFLHPQWGISYRFDRYDAGSDLDPFTASVRSLGHASEHVVGVCCNPCDSVRLRLDGHHTELPNTGDTVDFLNLSWSFSF